MVQVIFYRVRRHDRTGRYVQVLRTAQFSRGFTKPAAILIHTRVDSYKIHTGQTGLPSASTAHPISNEFKSSYSLG